MVHQYWMASMINPKGRLKEYVFRVVKDNKLDGFQLYNFIISVFNG